MARARQYKNVAVTPDAAARSGKPPARSGARGKPAADLLARVERKYPGIEEKIGLSSAALRAGQAVRSLRKSMGWTQTQLADALGWDQERISNIERGEGTRGPTYDVLQRIAAACQHELQFRPVAAHAPAVAEAKVEAEVEAEQEYTHRPFAGS